VAPTIGFLSISVRVALAVNGGDVWRRKHGNRLQLTPVVGDRRGSGTPVLSAVHCSVASQQYWALIRLVEMGRTPVPATPAVCSTADSCLLALLALVVVEAVASCRSSVVTLVGCRPRCVGLLR
jgi:hypothetical protein